VNSKVRINDWRGRAIEIAESVGGVRAVVDPWDNVISTGVRPWPVPELIQKIYQSRQTRAFRDDQHVLATSRLGFYSDVQSIHSEDAITWSVFGPVIYAVAPVREAFVADLLRAIKVPGTATNAHVWLWRRLPHPETLVSGGPEIDFGIQTDDVFVLGEAKWRSPIGVAQGVNRDKDQVILRREFCEKYGRRVLPTVRQFVVLAVSWSGGVVSDAYGEADGVGLYTRDATWRDLVEIRSHPCADEVRQYLAWKAEYSQPNLNQTGMRSRLEPQ
jgi:hypothetical protein